MQGRLAYVTTNQPRRCKVMLLPSTVCSTEVRHIHLRRTTKSRSRTWSPARSVLYPRQPPHRVRMLRRNLLPLRPLLRYPPCSHSRQLRLQPPQPRTPHGLDPTVVSPAAKLVLRRFLGRVRRGESQTFDKTPILSKVTAPASPHFERSRPQARAGFDRRNVKSACLNSVFAPRKPAVGGLFRNGGW